MISGPALPVRVTAAGTPVRVTSGYADPSNHISIHGVMFQALPTNTGLIYVGAAEEIVRATFAQVRAILGIPTDNFIPTFSAALTIAPNGLALEQFWIDADVSTDGVLVTYLQL